MNIRMFKLGQDSRLQLNSKVLIKKSGVFFGALMLPSGQNLHQHLYRKMRLKVVIVYFTTNQRPITCLHWVAAPLTTGEKVAHILHS